MQPKYILLLKKNVLCVNMLIAYTSFKEVWEVVNKA